MQTVHILGNLEKKDGGKSILIVIDGSGTMDFLSVFSLLWFFVKKNPINF